MARSAIKIADPETNVPEVKTLDTAALKHELSKALEVTARHLNYVAAIWRELESRGEDLSGLRSGLWAYMPLIASGKIRADLVVRFAGHTMLLKRLSELSMAEQMRVLSDDTVDLVEFNAGVWNTRKIRLTHLKSTQLSQVMSDHLHPEEEQRRSALVASKRDAKRRKPDIVRIAQESTGTIAGASSVTVSIPLTEEENDALKHHARETGVTIGRIVRAALIAKGLLGQRG